jgi:hypothetical protein
MNLILRMQKEGNISDSLPQIQSHIFKFYRALFGQVGNKQASTQDNFWDDQFKIGLSDQLLLEQPFTKKKLREAVFGSEAQGAPGPDGFGFLFYQYFFDLVKHNLLKILQHFYSHSLNTLKLNHAMVCLIPKEKEAKIIQKFRPINLMDYGYKILSKILTNRLTPFISHLVDHT